MDMPVFNIEKTCFFAGHRPYKFTYEPEQEERFLTTLKNSINKTVLEAFDNGYDTFLCGGAIGFDIMCAESVIELKKEFPEVRLVCMLPFENHHNSFPAEWQTRFTAYRNEETNDGVLGTASYVSNVLAQLATIEEDINSTSETAWEFLQECVDSYYYDENFESLYNVLDRTSRNDYEGSYLN